MVVHINGIYRCSALVLLFSNLVIFLSERRPGLHKSKLVQVHFSCKIFPLHQDTTSIHLRVISIIELHLR